jgi:protein-S-isoprenylcysteine O-methyltransferase Ste14
MARLKTYLQVLLVVGAFGYVFWEVHDRAWTPMRVGGAILVAAGVLGWAAARIELGASFAVAARAKDLVTGGVYAKIRNPIYVFSAMAVAGWALLFERPMWLLVLVVLVPVQVWRAGVEARVLEAKFGEAYREYRRKTWF